MDKKIVLFIVLLCSNFYLSAQEKFDANYPPNTFRNPDNPLYWKNRKPFADYWQQDIYYKIQATIDETTDMIDGKEAIIYWNNSPDTLHELFIHLYQAAFQPGSYFEDLNLQNKVKPRFGKYEKDQKTILVEEIKITDTNGPFFRYMPYEEYDNSILKISLFRPLPPGSYIMLSVKFKSYFDSGSLRRRMKIFNHDGYKHYDGVHWYPRIAVYDRKFGWETEQHLEKEFYGDFGTYDVMLNCANNFIVEATGTLQNREEVIPDSLRMKLDIKNFKDKPLNSRPSVIVPYDSTQRKVWKFYAENVHDFAFTADPTYRIGEAEWNGIKCIAIVQEPHAARWQNAADYTAKIIETYSNDFGMYGYPKMVVADARDGMEYPMLTLDGGLDPDYRSLLSHEVGHNWFFGMVGNNETYRAFLDEGFTQFLTSWALRKIDGEYPVRTPFSSWYKEKFFQKVSVKDGSIYNRYLNDVIRGNNPPINIHSSYYNGALGHGGGYRHVYMKTATMLYNLQYVLGDSLFQNAMKHYFNQWKFCHPYDEDFRNSIIQYTHVDLNWFFDQWINSSKEIDYKIKSVRKGKQSGEYKIKFSRKGSMQMPLDFQVTDQQNKRYNFLIPNTWFVKDTNLIVLPKWYGWDLIHKSYTANVKIPGGIKEVTIDTSKRLADINMMDNSTKKPVKFLFDSQTWNAADWKNYILKWRPDIWYNSYDGFKAGLHLDGNYMRTKNIFWLTAWYNTGLLQGGVSDDDFGSEKKGFNDFSFILNYQTTTYKFIPRSSLLLATEYIDGLHSSTAGMELEMKEDDKVYFNIKSMYRESKLDLNYLLYPQDWQAGRYNNTINIGYEHNYNYFKGNGKINLDFRNSVFNGDYNYGNLKMTVVNKTRFGKLDFLTRTFAQYGLSAEAPFESSLYAAGANQEEMMENKFTRSRGYIPNDWLGYGDAVKHFQQGGGLNLRGYAGYTIVESDGNYNYVIYNGNSGAAINAEIEFDDYFRFSPKLLRKIFHLDTYFFGDGGSMVYNDITDKDKFAIPRFDAGIGAALTIKKFGALETVEPLVIRFDVPLFLNRTPYVESDYVQFRWVIGIGRAF